MTVLIYLESLLSIIRESIGVMLCHFHYTILIYRETDQQARKPVEFIFLYEKTADVKMGKINS